MSLTSDDDERVRPAAAANPNCPAYRLEELLLAAEPAAVHAAAIRNPALPRGDAGRLLGVVAEGDDLLEVYRRRCDTELRGMDL